MDKLSQTHTSINNKTN